eukprot:CAMPEP_0114277862 /NCGR_PEP_ID=MMETSP0059-20121206/1024_1 /TAXON_ID=36894 /ORGANISM="Pyramimonas parkeae, Strain CCMP726" /LENGTH=263 /DNA_ID=CAMNT_0001398011 /DNA_START=69 /DNA_END=857 /DNA_ORIENTATION=+
MIGVFARRSSSLSLPRITAFFLGPETKHFTALSSQAFRNPLWDWEYGSSMPHIRLLENASWYQLKVPATQVLPEMSSISGIRPWIFAHLRARHHWQIFSFDRMHTWTCIIPQGRAGFATQRSPTPVDRDKPVSEPRGGQTVSTGGWEYEKVVNVANGISLGRLLSGPVIYHWIVTGQLECAILGLAAAGVSDWADGYVAKGYDFQSVLGSYLDPLADKALIVAVSLAIAKAGLLPAWVIATFVGRDVILTVGAFAHRAHVQEW